MSTNYTQIPPPDMRYYILTSSRFKTRYGYLTNTMCELKYNVKFYDIEMFENKELWIAKLAELGIEYIEEE